MLVGIGLLSVVTANIAAFFVEAENDDTAERLERIEALLQTLARHGNAPAELSASLDRSDRVPD
jgi:hypothetical protein